MRGGVLPNGERVLADGWMEASLTPSRANPGYGYLWWLRGGGTFAGIGIFGQVIWVDPAEGLVIVTHGAWPAASSLYGRVYAFAEAVREAL
jgi:CubicO group peptidase (beta-lactamase class C family)